MSNRTDFSHLVKELAEMFDLSPAAQERIETELHNAHVAGQEGSPCECRWCTRITALDLDCPDGHARKGSTARDG